MKKLIQVILISAFLSVIWGCSGGSGDEAAPTGSIPEIKQAEPGMLTPEERARQSGGGGEGSR